jgi:hypothetical protein
MIHDEFTDKPLSKQRRYQLRKQAKGLCPYCPNPLQPGYLRCREHNAYARQERSRRQQDAQAAPMLETAPGAILGEARP